MVPEYPGPYDLNMLPNAGANVKEALHQENRHAYKICVAVNMVIKISKKLKTKSMG